MSQRAPAGFVIFLTDNIRIILPRFFFSFPPLLLAMTLGVPTHSSDGETLYPIRKEDGSMGPDSVNI